jgi:hypothetical protein
MSLTRVSRSRIHAHKWLPGRRSRRLVLFQILPFMSEIYGDKYQAICRLVCRFWIAAAALRRSLLEIRLSCAVRVPLLTFHPDEDV